MLTSSPGRQHELRIRSANNIREERNTFKLALRFTGIRTRFGSVCVCQQQNGDYFDVAVVLRRAVSRVIYPSYLSLKDENNVFSSFVCFLRSTDALNLTGNSYGLCAYSVVDCVEFICLYEVNNMRELIFRHGRGLLSLV